MKSCPTCKQTFTDPNLSFCIDDGTPLVAVAEPSDETTVVSPTSGQPAEVYKPRDWQAPDYQPPGFHTSTSLPAKKKSWPWVVGTLSIVGIGVIGMVLTGLLVYKLVRPTVRRDQPIIVSPEANPNSNAPVSGLNNENSRSPLVEDDATPAPTDKDVVLAALTDLENDWTVANINADKQKLNRILADDYVGITEGKPQGKAAYLREAKRDTMIQKWKFEELQLDLIRDKATLEGVLRLQLTDREVAFRFTDRFVWRDGRWQAVGSEVSLIQ